MKKILVLFNGINAPWHITTFALEVAKKNNSEVHVLFLKDVAIDYPYPSDITSVQKDYSSKKEKADNKKLEDKNVALFTTFCNDEKVACYFEKNVSLVPVRIKHDYPQWQPIIRSILYHTSKWSYAYPSRNKYGGL